MLALYITVTLLWEGLMLLVLIERNLCSPVFLYVHIYCCTVTKALYTDVALLCWFNLISMLKQCISCVCVKPYP